MPLTNREIAILGILIFCVPVQLWLSKLSTLTSEEKGMRVQEFFIRNRLRLQALTSPSFWIFQIKDFLKYMFDKADLYNEANDPLGECPAVEVLKYRYPQGFFATSHIPRKPKPDEVKYRIGQVIRHKKSNYIGVIIGWDETCKAPDLWIKQMHGSNHNWRNQPNYSVLVDVRYRPNPQTTYVVQENIEIVKEQVDHPEIDDYFDSFDGAQYLAQPWLKAIYPLDQ
ncbi:UNVERIFIED_CONTAM: hypothetical protein RMT77_007770 [Armadillidium vulgare]